MKAFVIATNTINDEAMFAKYREEAPATIEAFGGKFIVRGGNFKNLEGEWPHPRLAIIEAGGTLSVRHGTDAALSSRALIFREGCKPLGFFP